MATPRAQAKSTNGPRPRILRIGILLGGKLVEERLIRERVSVLIGQGLKNNTFSIPLEGLPLEFTLFPLVEGKYSLRFLPKMDGRVSDAGGTVATLDQLKTKGAQNHGEYWSVPLGDSARGKLSLGDLTILFQFVTEPPRQPKPMLPASVRGTFADRFDPRLSVIMGVSIIAHFAIVIFALMMDLDTGDSMAERAYNLTFKQDTYNVDLTPPPVPDKVEAGSAAGSAVAKVPDKTPDKTPSKAPPTTVPDNSGRKEADAVALKEEQAKAMADLLTGEGEKGTSEGDMSKRRPGADLGQQIADVKEGGKLVAVGGGTGRGSRGNGDPRVGTGKGPAIDGPNGKDVANTKTGENGPAGRISVSDKQTFDDSTLTPDIVLQKIMAAYMAGLKRCYKEYLKKDASARGKIGLEFAVNATGKTVNGKATGVAEEVDSCIGNLMGGWHFSAPKDKSGDPTEASFKITLQLVPD